MSIQDEVFVTYVANLHAEKHAVYGDSWKRRGETVAILANIARKVDRLGVAGAGDTSADTAIDLLVYLCKYRLWLHNELHEPLPMALLTYEHLEKGEQQDLGDGPEPVATMLAWLPDEDDRAAEWAGPLIEYVQGTFEMLLERQRRGETRYLLVDGMINATNQLARYLWGLEQEHPLVSVAECGAPCPRTPFDCTEYKGHAGEHKTTVWWKNSDEPFDLGPEAIGPGRLQ